MLNYLLSLRKQFIFFLVLISCFQGAQAQVIWSTTATVWLTGTNWTGGVVPTGTQIAQFNANPSASAGIDMGGATNNGTANQAVGAIYASSTRTGNLSIGNSSTTTDGTLTLNGATVLSTANTALANFSASGATRPSLTLQNIQNTGTHLTTVALGSGLNILTGAGPSATAIGNTINITSVVSGSGTAPIFLGGGTWNGSTGLCGGLLKLGAANTFTGGITVGANDGTQNGILELDTTLAISNTSGNNITVNPFSELYLNGGITGSTYTTGNLTLTLNGNGNTATTTTTGGALVSAKTYTWTGPTVLQTNAKISVIGSATLTLSGNISGNGALIKTGSTGNGNLTLTGTGNTWSGGTQITAGSITVASGSSLGSTSLAMIGTTNNINTTLTLNNTAQTLTSLASVFIPSSGTITQTISIASGHTLTLNLPTDTTYGAGAVNTLNSVISGAGRVIKNNSTRLTLSGKGTYFTGGLTINAGELRFNPCGAITMASPDTLNGGNISTVNDTNAATITMGTLALLDNTNINLGNSCAHSLKFANSNAITWTAGKTLTITGWNGSWGAGTTGTLGKIFAGTNATGLTVGQLAQIIFIDGSGNVFPAKQLGTGEVIPKLPTITTTVASFGPFHNNTGNAISVAFTTSAGTFFSKFKVQLSDATGIFTADTVTGILDSGLSSPISATIPTGTPIGNYRVRVINGQPNTVYGTDNGSNISIITYPPVISSLSDTTDIPDSVITITGTNFNPTPLSNIVYFGATRATVLSGSFTSLTVRIPDGALYGPVSVLDSPVAITGYSTSIMFSPTFPGSLYVPNVLNFKNKVDFSAGANPTIAAIGDLDGDGKPDLVIANTGSSSPTTLSIYRNTSTPGTISGASFSAGTPVTLTGASPTNVKIADLDGDGKLDVMATSLTTGRVNAFRNTSTVGTISFGSDDIISTVSSGSDGAQPYVIAVADFDGDGKADLATTSPYISATHSSVSVMRNTSTVGTLGSGSFATAVTFNTPASLGTYCGPIGICAADFDGDGKPDIAVACSTSVAVAVYRNTATSGVINSSSFATPQTFTVGTSGASPIDVQAADVDGDGKIDLIVTDNGTSKLSILRNTSTLGSISFATDVLFSTGSSPTGAAVGDFDGDGKIDIAVTNALSNTVSVFRNKSTPGSFTTASLATKADLTTGSVPYGVNIGDLDGDGHADIVVANNTGNSISVIRDFPTPKSSAITGTFSVCPGNSVTVTDSIAGGIWSMTNNKATIDSAGHITGITAGTDTVVYTIVAGYDTAIVKATFTITSAPVVNPIGGSTTTVCPGSTITLTESTGGGTWGITNAHATVSGGVVTGVTTGADTVTYTVTSGCSTTVTKPINVSLTPFAGGITGASSVCVGSTITLADTIGGGSWTSSNNSWATVNSSGVVTGVAAGSVTISYTITNSCGSAVVTAPVTVIAVPATPSAITGAATVCISNTTTLSDATAGGTWTSSTPSFATINSSTGIASGIAAGALTITYTVSNTCGSAYITTPFTVLALPVASITSAVTPCTGYATNIVFSGASGDTIRYNIDAGPSVDAVLTGGTYSLNTGAISSAHTYKLVDVRNASCTSAIDTTITVTPAAIQWVGGTSGHETDWNYASNWGCGVVPANTDNITIPFGTTYSPEILASATASAQNITIASGATIKVDSAATLNIKGDVTNNGKLTGTGTYSMSGSSAQTINGKGYVAILEINNSNGVSIGSLSSVSITNVLTLTSGILTTNDSLILYSDSNLTARIAPISGTDTVAGNVKVMQYIHGGRRAFRFWGHPFNAAIALSQIENYIDITGTGGASHGFTSTITNAPSAFRYNPLQGNSSLGYDPGWRPFTNCSGVDDSNLFHQYQGIRLFIRGSKGQGLDGHPYTPSPVTISMMGHINQGNQHIILSKGTDTTQDYNQIGNPYPSPVDIGTVVYNAWNNGKIMGSAIFVWNPYLGSIGQFEAAPITTGTPYMLQANSSFQVRAANNGDTLFFTESNKAASFNTNLLRTQPAGITLSVVDDTYHLWDRLNINFNENATANEDRTMDAIKPSGPAELNFYSLSADKRKLAIDARPYHTGDLVPLGIGSNYQQEFIIKADNIDNSENQPVFLHDKLKTVYTRLQPGTEYRFAVTADTATQGNNRFELTLGLPAADNKAQALAFTATPNPAHESVKLQYTSNGKDAVKMAITDINGVTVYSGTLTPAMSGNVTVPLQSFAPGIYLVTVTCGNTSITSKLIRE